MFPLLFINKFIRLYINKKILDITLEEKFVHSKWIASTKSSIFCGSFFAIFLFNSAHIFSIGLTSGLWDGQSNNLTLISKKNFQKSNSYLFISQVFYSFFISVFRIIIKCQYSTLFSILLVHFRGKRVFHNLN